MPRELAPDLTALTGQIVRLREDKGSSLRFEAAETYNMRHGLAADAASQKLRVALEKSREVLTAAAQAKRVQLRQVGGGAECLGVEAHSGRGMGRAWDGKIEE